MFDLCGIRSTQWMNRNLCHYLNINRTQNMFCETISKSCCDFPLCHPLLQTILLARKSNHKLQKSSDCISNECLAKNGEGFGDGESTKVGIKSEVEVKYIFYVFHTLSFYTILASLCNKAFSVTLRPLLYHFYHHFTFQFLICNIT